MRIDSHDIRETTGRSSSVVDIWRPPPNHPSRSAYARVGKNVLDVMVGAVLLVLTLPLQLGLYLTSALLFRHRSVRRLPRMGMNNEIFAMYRFATRRPDRDDERWQRVGERIRDLGLDELPQLWNVLMGQMSLVGPRPRRVSRADLSLWDRQCALVRPGVTGLAQLETRTRDQVASTEHFDIQYIDRMSVRADLRILLRTVPTVLRPEGSRRADDDSPRQVVHAKLLIADFATWLAAIAFATWAHFDFDRSQIEPLGTAMAALGAVALHLVWARRYGIYRGRWRLTSLGGLTSVIAGAGVVGGLISLASLAVDGLPPASALLPAAAIYVVGAISTRLAAASIHERQQRSQQDKTSRLLVFGAGEAGRNAAKAIYADDASTFIPVAFLDDSRGRRRTTVLGLPVVGGRYDIADAARRYDADTILIAMPSAHPKEANDVASIAEAAGLEVQVLPPLAQWLSALLVERTDHVVPELRQAASSRPPVHSEHIQNRQRIQIFDLAVVGLGYVGLPLALEASKAGLRVCGLDIDPSRIQTLTRGDSYIDDVSTEDVQRAVEAGFVANTDPAILALADAITISVPTPLRDGLPDLSAVVSASEAVGDHLLPGQLVVLESTTYPGTTEEVVLPILESRSGLRAGVDFHLAYSPERIDPGNHEYGIHNTPKLIAGIDQASTERGAALYGKFSPVVEMTGTREAEMAKLLENTYRHVNIALINELAVFCHELGVDIWETIRGAATKPFGFQAFYPGPGVGGHCIPIDPNYLSYRVRQLGKQFKFIELAQEINEFMPGYVADRSLKILDREGVAHESASVLILGVAYKPDIGDVRETTATAIVRHLREAGATVEYCDPHVPSFSVDGIPVTRREDAVKASAEADLTLVHTPHHALDLHHIIDSAKSVFDLRGAIARQGHERI